MLKLFTSSLRLWVGVLLSFGIALLNLTPVQAQIFAPEGVHMPGSWNSFQNYPNPATNFAIRGTTSAGGGSGNNLPATGGINRKISAAGGSAVYQTTIYAAAVGGNFVGGAYEFLFTSGNPTGGQYGNKWVGSSVVMNTLQAYTYNSGPNTNISIVNGNYYTSNLIDNGYGASSAIFMQTSAAPIDITNITQSPIAGSITPSNAVTVSLTLSAPKSAQENVFIRYSSDNYGTSAIVQATGSGTAYTATIPAQPDGVTINYYGLTSTVSQATLAASNISAFDAYAIRYKNNSGAAYVYTSAAVPPVNITFRVDMQNETVSGGGLHLAGTFNGFSTSAITLTQEGATTIYSTVVALAQNSPIQYKFVNGTSFEDNVGGVCGNGSNRIYTVGTANATINLTCYGRCGACLPFRSVTFVVDMQNQAAVTSVSLSGEMNGFNTSANPMTNSSGSLWTTTVSLEEARAYSYKFVRNGGDYEDNIPSGACNPGGGGGGNRQYTVTAAPTQTVASTCFSSCGACPALSVVTLSVDMRDQNVTNGVVLSGNFNGFNTTATPMNQIGSTSVYTVNISIAEGYALSYKFVNGNGTNNYEPNPGACGPNNRAYTVPVGNSTVATVCFGSCSACAPKFNVTFRVNLATQTVTGTPSIIGDFNGYSTTANPLTQIGATGVWQTTINIAQGPSQFKFYNPGGPNSGFEGNINAPCGNGGNRVTTVPGNAVTLATVCFNSCLDCGAINVWTGAVNTLFNNGANWSGGTVPSGCSGNFQVNAGGNQPTTAAVSTFSVGNVVLQSGATLALGAGATLNVCGNMSGTGGAISGGTVIVNGTGAQTMSGNATIDNLTVNKTAGTLTVSGTARVKSTLTLANATSGVNITGALILLSDAAGTGRLAAVPTGATITGNLTLQRYVPGTRGWHFVGAPFTAATTLADFNEAGARVSPKNNANLYEYSEPDTTSLLINNVYVEQNGWKVPASLANSVNPSNAIKGYRIFAGNAFLAGGRTIATTGAPFLGDKTVSYTVSANGYDGGGWNLIASPYASEINWNAARFDAANTGLGLSNAYTIWNSAANSYSSYTALNVSTGVAAGIPTEFISSSQGMFIKATTPGVITFKEAHKASSNGNTFVRRDAASNVLSFRLAQDNTWDDGAVAFYEGAQELLDNFDAQNMAGPGIDLATTPAQGLNLAINVLPELVAEKQIPVSFRLPSVGAATFTFSGFATFDAGTQVYLRDAFLNTLTNLNSNPVVSFTATTDPATTAANRFTVIFTPASVTSVGGQVATQASMSVWPNPVAGEKLNVSLRLFGQGNASIKLVDALGRTVSAESINLATGNSTAVRTAGLAPGVYTLVAASATQRMVKQVVIR